MMAEQKFNEIQKLIEIHLPTVSDDRYELLQIYYESMKVLNKELPDILVIELIRNELRNKNYTKIDELLCEIDMKKYYSVVLEIKSELADRKGQLQEVYNLISDYLIRQFENKKPTIPPWLINLKNKYFKNDFKLNLYFLSIHLMLNDLRGSEAILRELILEVRERATSKGTEDKLNLIEEVLKNNFEKAYLEIYQNYCHLYSKGLTDKSQFKKIIEMIIYFDDFKFQVLILDLLQRLNLQDELIEYSQSLKENQEYSFVYLDKYFSHLKYLFYQPEIKEPKVTEYTSPVDINAILETPILNASKPKIELLLDEELHISGIANFIKYQDYSFGQLCEVIVSLVQLEMPRAALEVASIATQQVKENEEFLKICYLKITCYLILRDYRAVLDLTFQALAKVELKNDILSFLYAQAEAYIGLREKNNAIVVLSKIISIDHKYRMARERLEKINEI